MNLLIAFSDNERVALIGVVAALAAGIPASITMWLTNRVKNENTSQHGEVHSKLDSVEKAIVSHGTILSEIKSDVTAIAVKVDAHSETLARQDERLSRHERDTGRPALGLTGTDSQGPHPVL